MAKGHLVKGHGLLHEGRVPGLFYWGTGPGSAKCSCGWESEELLTTAARQRAHKVHKLKVCDCHPNDILKEIDDEQWLKRT